MVYDVAIIGAGATGAFVARKLSMFTLDVCLLDSGEDIVSGASKANSGIVHAGYDPKPGTLKARLNLMGGRLMPQVAEELDVPYKKTGSFGRIIFQCPTVKGKGVLVTPTVDGDLLAGPTSDDVFDRYDTSTSGEGLAYVIRQAMNSVPGLDMGQVITSFAGLRARSSTGDFVIKASDANPRFINASGIDCPGLSAAPAAGRYVAGLT